MKPETPLPWKEKNFSFSIFETLSEEDLKYALHACNAYPKLVAFVTAYYQNTFPHSKVAEEILVELGEL